MKIAVLALGTHAMSHYAAQSANALAEKNLVVTITSKASQNLYSEKVKIEAFYPKQIKIPKFVRMPSLTSYVELHNLLSKISPDVIYDPVGPAFAWTTGARFFLKRWPLLITIHDPKPHSNMEYPFQKTVIKFSWKLADIVLVHGENCKLDLIKSGCPDNRIKIVPFGCYTFFNQGRTDIQEEDNTILFFGKMRLNKGIDRLFDISNRVRKQIPNVKFLVVGSSKQITRWTNQDRIQNILKEIKSSANFEVHDEYIPDNEVEIYFRRASVVLLPYNDATQSAIVPIAYPFGKPVVATRVGDLQEAIEDGKTGFIANPESNQDIANKIIHILQNNTLRKQMGENAYRKSQNELSWSVAADKITAICHQLIMERKCPK
jgi:glycosyltransferase involved in cell wall biosynthesis